MKKFLTLALTAVMALSLLPTKAWGYYVLQGSGTEEIGRASCRERV